MVYIIGHKIGSSDISPMKIDTVIVWRGAHVPIEFETV